MNEIIECYTDASYSQFAKFSVVGYKIGNSRINLEILKNIKNTQAELYAIEKCITICNIQHVGKKIMIYTDCQKAIQNFQNNKYQKHINLIKVDGHKKNILRDNHDKIFNLVDKATRKELRKNVKIDE